MTQKARKKKRRIEKVVDETFLLRARRAKLREEVWQTQDGDTVKYNLAYINPRVCGLDNGRVLGYDNSHDHHHRHFMGSMEPFDFDNYKALVKRFYEEVQELWRIEDEGKR